MTTAAAATDDEVNVNNEPCIGFGHLRDGFLGLKQNRAGGIAGSSMPRGRPCELKRPDCKMWIVPKPRYGSLP
jgi:hypothetical protein